MAGHRRHRHAGLLDRRRLRSAPRPGRVPLPGSRRRRLRRVALGGVRVRRACSVATNRVLGSTIDRDHLNYLPCSLLAAEHGEPVRQSRGRELGGALPIRQVGVGRLPLRRAGERSGAQHDRHHVLVRLRPPAGHAPGRHVRRASPTTTTRARTTRPYGAAGLASAAHRDQGILELRVHAGRTTRAGRTRGGRARRRPIARSTLDRAATRAPDRDPRPTPGASPEPTRSCWTRSWRNGPTGLSWWVAGFPRWLRSGQRVW